ncbi:MAG: ATP-binding protein, partial [Desulfohalobiaceae bacterium]
ELLSRPFETFIHPEDREPTRSIVQEKLGAGLEVMNFENRFQTRDGHYRWLRWVSKPVLELGVTFAIARDVTDQKTAEEALKQSEAQSRAILNAHPDLIFQISADGRFTGFKGREDLLLPVNEFIGKTMEEVLPDFLARKIRQGIDAVLSGREIYEYEYPLTVAGKEKFYEARMTLLDRGSVLVLVRDVTAQKEAEAERTLLEKQLRQAQKMEAVGTLAGGIAHDFNNILAAIVNLSVLARRQTEDELLLQDMDQITTAALRGKDLVRQVLFFSRKSTEEQVPVQAASQIKEIVKFLRSSTPTTITIKQELNDEGMVLISPTHLHQIVVNICSNAVEAMLPDKGRLNIRLSPYGAVTGEVPRPATDLQEDCLVLTIRDSGPGIDPALEERVFEPFFTTKPPGQGTGLGLAVVHGLVKEAGGDILLDNHPGNGCAFHVYFPRHSGRYEVQPVEEQVSSQGTGRILFVDDEEAITDSSVRVLQMHGFQATGVVDPVAALELFTSDPQAFDLAVVDLTMPGMSGKELIRKLNSGYALETDPGEEGSLGFAGKLTKPVRPSRLISEIRKILAHP